MILFDFCPWWFITRNFFVNFSSSFLSRIYGTTCRFFDSCCFFNVFVFNSFFSHSNYSYFGIIVYAIFSFWRLFSFCFGITILKSFFIPFHSSFLCFLVFLWLVKIVYSNFNFLYIFFSHIISIQIFQQFLLN